jgi:hypothetical protein
MRKSIIKQLGTYLYKACSTAYTNAMLSSDLFEVIEMPAEATELDFIIARLTSDDACDFIRHNRNGSVIRSLPKARRWGGAPGDICIITRDPELRNKLTAASTSIFANSQIVI